MSKSKNQIRITPEERDLILNRNPHLKKLNPHLARVIRDPKPQQQASRGMNKLEMSYANYLEMLKRQGEIIDYGYEEYKLKLAKKTTYTPDFWVITKEGHLEFHETKGFMRDDAAVKIKTAAEKFPRHTFKLIYKDKDRGWDIHTMPPHDNKRKNI